MKGNEVTFQLGRAKIDRKWYIGPSLTFPWINQSTFSSYDKITHGAGYPFYSDVFFPLTQM